jgi:phosphate transport system permease protein
MSSAISQESVAPKPGKPWEPTVRERSQKVLNFFISLALSFVLLFTTGLNGKLGWFFAFFFSFTVVSFIAEFRRAGKPAAQDSLLTSVSRFAITLAVIPIVSILATVVAKGWR